MRAECPVCMGVERNTYITGGRPTVIVPLKGHSGGAWVVTIRVRVTVTVVT